LLDDLAKKTFRNRGLPQVLAQPRLIPVATTKAGVEEQKVVVGEREIKGATYTLSGIIHRATA
jgi:hypothetical protein